MSKGWKALADLTVVLMLAAILVIAGANWLHVLMLVLFSMGLAITLERP